MAFIDVVPVATSGGGGLIYEAKIEDGKLFYENRWFHKGQHIFIESKEHGQERYTNVIAETRESIQRVISYAVSFSLFCYSGVVTSISQSEVWGALLMCLYLFH